MTTIILETCLMTIDEVNLNDENKAIRKLLNDNNDTGNLPNDNR